MVVGEDLGISRKENDLEVLLYSPMLILNDYSERDDEITFEVQ